MLYLFLIGQEKLRELIYLWILFNSRGIKCNISYIKNIPSLERELGFNGVKVFVKNSNKESLNVLDLRHNIYLIEKPINLNSIDILYKDIAELL